MPGIREHQRSQTSKLRNAVGLAVVATIVSGVLGGPFPTESASAVSPSGETAIIQGTLLRPDGAPPSDVVVTAFPADGYAHQGGSTYDPSTGQFRITGLDTGFHWRVLFQYQGAENFVRNLWWPRAFNSSTSDRLILAPDETRSLEATLVPGATITGVVTGNAGQNVGPASAVWASARSFGASSFTGSMDSASGQYTIRQLPPGMYEVSLGTTDASWAPVNFLVDDVPEGGTVTRDVVLQPGTSISGQVMLETGEGLVPYVGPVYLFQGTDYYHFDSVSTDADGRYAFYRHTPGTYRLCFGYNVANRTHTCWGGDEGTAIVLEDGEVLTGFDGIVIGHGSVTGTLFQQGDDGPEAVVWPRVDAWRWDGDLESWVLEAEHVEYVTDGQFSLNLRVGDYRLQFSGGFGGTEYWENSRYFTTATIMRVTVDEVIDLGSITLPDAAFDVTRLTGSDRFGTSVAVAQQLFPTGEVPDGGIPVVYIANGLNYPDALAAGPAAIINGGVVLLTYPWELPGSVNDELMRLRPQRIVVVGGIPSVDSGVYAELEDLDFEPSVERITGVDRFGTSRAMARDTFPDGAEVAFVATGMNFPDALAAGPAAGLSGAPIVLVNGLAGALDAGTTKLLDDLEIDYVFIIGGYPSVSAGIENGLRAALGSSNVARITGADRFGTAVAISQTFFGEADAAFVATGLNFPDALAGGPAAGALGSPLYLSRQDCIPSLVAADISDVGAREAFILGGYPSLSLNVEELGVC